LTTTDSMTCSFLLVVSTGEWNNLPRHVWLCVGSRVVLWTESGESSVEEDEANGEAEADLDVTGERNKISGYLLEVSLFIICRGVNVSESLLLLSPLLTPSQPTYRHKIRLWLETQSLFLFSDLDTELLEARTQTQFLLKKHKALHFKIQHSLKKLRLLAALPG